MKALYKTFSLCLALSVCLLLCSCSRCVINSGDELTLNTWQTQFDNGNVVSLSFDADNATFSLTYSDKTKVELCGLCELSNTSFVIHDNDTLSEYKFDYIVHFDSVDITYADTTVSLNKIS